MQYIKKIKSMKIWYITVVHSSWFGTARVDTTQLIRRLRVTVENLKRAIQTSIFDPNIETGM